MQNCIFALSVPCIPSATSHTRAVQDVTEIGVLELVMDGVLERVGVGVDVLVDEGVGVLVGEGVVVNVVVVEGVGV